MKYHSKTNVIFCFIIVVYFVAAAVTTNLSFYLPILFVDAQISCHMKGEGLPDPNCTPGATNPNVTQENIHQTICVPGYSASIRPDPSYTDHLKEVQMQSYGFGGNSTSNYEEDHLIPLAVGGNPTDPKNLWPQPRTGVPYTAGEKDGLEYFLYKAVCRGDISLADAQKEFSSDWISNWIAAGRP